MHLGLFIAGVVLIGFSAMGFIYPYYASGATVIQVSDLCLSGVEDLAVMFGVTDTIKLCNEARTMTYAIYGGGALGIALLVVGLVKKDKEEN